MRTKHPLKVFLHVPVYPLSRVLAPSNDAVMCPSCKKTDKIFVASTWTQIGMITNHSYELHRCGRCEYAFYVHTSYDSKLVAL